jgi:hypothetical protein
MLVVMGLDAVVGIHRAARFSSSGHAYSPGRLMCSQQAAKDTVAKLHRAWHRVRPLRRQPVRGRRCSTTRSRQPPDSSRRRDRLRLSAAIADSPEAVEKTDRARRVAGVALVQADLKAAAQFDVLQQALLNFAGDKP